MALVRADFVGRMEAELQANTHKGDWSQWSPSPLEALAELQHHEAKLIKALSEGDYESVTEFSADIANIAMKIEETFGALTIGKGKRVINFGVPRPFEGEPFFYAEGPRGHIIRLSETVVQQYWDNPGSADWSQSAYTEMGRRVLANT